jgi:hypothetical protein
MGAGLACPAANADAEAAERAIVDAHEPGGAPSVVKAVPAPTEDTTSVELASVAEGATMARPEALEPCMGCEGRQGCDKAPRDGAAVDSNGRQERHLRQEARKGHGVARQHGRSPARSQEATER